MTKEEIYDLALKRYKEPAVLRLGSEYILGYWLLKTEAKGVPLMLEGHTSGVVLVARAASLDLLAKEAGLMEEAAPPPAASSSKKLNGARKR